MLGFYVLWYVHTPFIKIRFSSTITCRMGLLSSYGTVTEYYLTIGGYSIDYEGL